MKNFNKFISLLLSAAMLLSLAGCKEEPAPGTTSSPPGPTTAPVQDPAETTAPSATQPQADAAQLYLDALEAIAQIPDQRYEVNRTDTMLVGTETLSTVSSAQIEYLDLGTEDFAARKTEHVAYGTYETDIEEIYVGSTLYLRVFGSGFVREMTPEDCIDRYPGPDMIDPGLYAAVTAAEEDGKTVLHFSEAASLESWLETDADRITSAEAEITLASDGSLQAVQYLAEYYRGNVAYSTQIQLYVRGCVIDYIQAPPDCADYATLSYIDAPIYIEQAYGFLTSVQSVTFGHSQMTQSDAAGFIVNETYTVNTYGTGNDYMSMIEQSYYAMDYSTNESYQWTFDEVFRDGKYTSSEDDAAPVADRSVTGEMMQSYTQNLISEYFLDCAYLTGAECTDLGSLLLIDFTCSEELSRMVKENICMDIFEDADLLDDLAAAYRTNTISYYLAIDKYTGFPTAIGLNYEGVHTIDGYDYRLIRQPDQSVYLASLDSHEAITQQSAPDTEPEEKATPVFYHVTGPDGQELWLLGIIHVGDDRTGYLPREIYDAFEDADALAVECNTRTFEDMMEADESLQSAVSDAYYYSDGTTAQDHAGDAEVYDLALKLMKATGNYFYNAPYLKICMWANSIDNFCLQQSYDLSSDKGVDNRLLMMAEKSGKKILEVESNLFQLQMLTGWSEPLQQLLLAESVKMDTISYMVSLDELYGMWCAGDEAELIAYLNEPITDLTAEEQKLYEEYNKAMSDDRNADMIQVAIDYLESGETVFYAVGLAHVLAEDGLVNGLRDAGYTVELVTYE